MNYLLDTNACIALINGKPIAVRHRFQRAIAAGEQVNVSTIAVFELWYGVEKSEQQEANTDRLQVFLAGPITLMVFEEEDANSAGTIRAALEKVGRPIGAYDLLIAAQAVRHKITLVTANSKEFSRVKGLVWEDWAKA
ncbi:MAG: VapC toxin family PIN domain ribonuclease [Cyanobacteria bacterium 13_1_20CM_4_61_6]|nr:MAG: VapC toxin family PIN domain ribonuclease [Cyanobacteria bacterium 13_1_20CM_4_61_6]